MTIYEQIENTVNYIEENIFEDINLDKTSRISGMSKRSFQNYFWVVTGFRFKEYIIKRRLSRAVKLIENSNRTILDIGIEIGYSSNEAFTRAFKKEFTVSPAKYRELRPALQILERVKLYKEKYMGVIVKELKEIGVKSFEFIGKNCEEMAKKLLQEWLKGHPLKNCRIFGYNIDENREQYNGPDNKGYRFLLASSELSSDEHIESGKFVITGIEGNFNEDPTGSWITKGWERLHNMVEEKGYKIKDRARWFEEELIPQNPGNLRLDLYLEIE